MSHFRSFSKDVPQKSKQKIMVMSSTETCLVHRPLLRKMQLFFCSAPPPPPPPPELHLLLGTVNFLFDEMAKLWPEAEDIISPLHVQRVEYHGNGFNGNDARKILKYFDKERVAAPVNVEKFINAFQAFNVVVEACLVSYLHTDFKSKIKKFELSYKKFGISITPKGPCRHSSRP